MLDILISGGWLMAPILLCSVVALAIVLERIIVLRKKSIMPKHLVAEIWVQHQNQQLDKPYLESLRVGSPLGAILAAGLINQGHSREVLKESIEEAGRHMIHGLERYLSTLGTIAAITPLLGLLGTVVGMIRVFAAIKVEGVGNSEVLAGGISEALITTATGLCVAIPSLIFHRYLMRKVDDLAVGMEQEAIKLVEVLHGEREMDQAPEHLL